jgi:hypothetical protein
MLKQIKWGFIMVIMQYFEMGRVDLETLGFHTNGWKKTDYASSSFSEY